MISGEKCGNASSTHSVKRVSRLSTPCSTSRQTATAVKILHPDAVWNRVSIRLGTDSERTAGPYAPSKRTSSPRVRQTTPENGSGSVWLSMHAAINCGSKFIPFVLFPG